MYLKKIRPTPEQRKIFFLDPNKPVLLSGRAGSGKTTTAILRAAQLVRFYERQGLEPRVGFFVYNNTLKTYLNTLAEIELQSDQYDVWTLDHWSRTFLHNKGLLSKTIADDDQCMACLLSAIRSVGLGSRQPQLVRFGKDFLIEEVDYLLGRFGLDTDRYLNSERVGRGLHPVITDQMKQAIALELVPSYQYTLESQGVVDWNQMRYLTLTYLKTGVPFDPYEIVVVDEAQDLCALQIQIALELASPQTQAITFIKDGTQRIYKANYIWDDVNLMFGPGTQLELFKNYRNTQEIAQVAASLMRSEADKDINILDPALTTRLGVKPVWVQGKYTVQKRYLKQQLRRIDLNNESVAILHIQSKAVGDLAQELIKLGYACTILKQDDTRRYAPTGIYLSTLNSAKGLEFDHLFIIGYDDFFAPGPRSLSHRETSAQLSTHRKLLYTAISRAKMTLTIASSVDKYSRFLKDIDKNLLDIIRL